MACSMYPSNPEIMKYGRTEEEFLEKRGAIMKTIGHLCPEYGTIACAWVKYRWAIGTLFEDAAEAFRHAAGEIDKYQRGQK